MQSLGRMNASDVTILLAKLLESNPQFYEYFISLETDGDVEKFKKLLHNMLLVLHKMTF